MSITNITTATLTNRIAKKGAAINKAAWALTNLAPGESLKVQGLADAWDDMKEELQRRGEWDAVCDQLGWDRACEAFDFAC